MSATVGASSGTGTGVRVLVVDDSPDHRVLIKRRLTSSGFDVTTASSAEDARPLVDGRDLVLLDYRLPGQSGIDLLDELRRAENSPSVIMVTGAGNTDVAVEAMRRGAIDYVSKDHGYLDGLPDVVDRAWRHHDLSRRASELQRLALLVTSARERDGLLAEITAGAARLLRASASVLLLDDDGVLRRAHMGGDPPDLLHDVAGQRSVEACGDGVPAFAEGRLQVPLPRGDGTCIGLLVAWTDARRDRDEEVSLAAAFASFAGIALRNLQQRELEQSLVSELQQTVDARRDFITSVSHELRTPLTSINGFAATLVDHWDELDDGARLDMLARVRRNSDDLRVLVDEMVDLAALDRGQALSVQLEEVRLEQVIADVLGDSEDVLAGRDVTVDLPDVMVRADVTLVRRTMHNLLTNAVKYSQPGAPVAVGASTNGSGHVRIEVRDRGAGLERRVAARVFDPFFRAPSAVTGAVRGAGVGLALVREYIRLMGGEVGVESVVGEGSTFWFTLPEVVGRSA